MRKILNILLGFCLFCSLPTFAEPQQTINNEQGYALVNIQKAPASENKQQIKNTKSWFCINIIVNGKVKDTGAANTDN